jgi:hypothetical protein
MNYVRDLQCCPETSFLQLKKALPTVPYYYDKKYTMGISCISLRESLSPVRAYVGDKKCKKLQTDFSEYSLNPHTYPRKLSVDFICTPNIIGRLKKLLGSK